MVRSGWRAALAGVAALAVGCIGGTDSGPSPALTVSPESLTLTTTNAQYYYYGLASFEISDPPEDGLWVEIDYTNSAVSSADFSVNSPSHATLWVYFKPPNTLAPGTYTDTVTLRVCYDNRCRYQIRGSPKSIPVTLTVQDAGSGGGDPPPDPDPQPEPGEEALPISNQHPLGHDVIDAEYSAMLDAVVMVASYPAPALYLYDPATRTEQSLALDKAPSSVSVGPDGLSAAVGHDALITVVDLTRLDDPLVSPKTLLNVTTNVLDVVLADNGYVYGFPRSEWGKIHSVHIATNTETLSTGYSIYAGTQAKLHPSGTKMYGADNGVSPSDIERYGIGAGTAAVEYDSPYHGDYAVCGNLWMHEDGARIYTACGNTFRTSDNRNQDMTYAGALELSEDQYYGSRIKSLSHSAERGEVALLDESDYACEVQESGCYTHLGLYDSDYLNLAVRYSLAPVFVEAAGQSYAQRGLFVFHSSDGTTRYLISRLMGMPDPGSEYLIGEVDVAGSPPPGPEPEPPPAPVVNPSTEPGLAAAPLTDVAAVPHDIVDAEFSTALNAIVMVSSYPTNALYLHDMATRTERSIALVKAPTSVSVAPDGLHAAVGHDALVTVVDLSPGEGAEAPRLLDASLDVLDVVMAGNGYVYAFPRVDQWANIHSIHIATNTETLSAYGAVYAGTFARLHPSGTKMYGADNGLSPSDIERYSIAGGTAQLAYDSPYHGDYAMCGNLWFGESGVNIYTACGNTFRSSDVQSQDMLYAGALQLSTSQTYGYRIVSASESAEAQQVALIEHDAFQCGPYGQPGACYSHVNLYGSQFLTRTARYSLSPFTVAGNTYSQRGMFVFHNGAGTQRYVVSRLYGMPNPYAEFYISRM